MKKRLLAVTTSAVVLSSILAIPAFAQTSGSANAATGASVSATVGNAVTSATNAVTGAGVTVTNTGSTGTTGTSGTGTSVNVGVSGSGSNSTMGTGAVSTNDSATADTSAAISLSSSDAAVQNYNPNSSVSVTNADMVQSNDQLNAYAAGVMHSDPNVQNVQLSNNSVSMNYKEQGHFLGFIPVTVSSTAMINSDGTVSISHPWYDFLTSTNDSAIQTAAKAQVKATTGSSATSTFSTQMQAELMDDLYAAFSGKMNMGTVTSSTDTTGGDASSTANMQGSIQDSMQSTSTVQ